MLRRDEMRESGLGQKSDVVQKTKNYEDGLPEKTISHGKEHAGVVVFLSSLKDLLLNRFGLKKDK